MRGHLWVPREFGCDDREAPKVTEVLFVAAGRARHISIWVFELPPFAFFPSRLTGNDDIIRHWLSAIQFQMVACSQSKLLYNVANLSWHSTGLATPSARRERDNIRCRR